NFNDLHVKERNENIYVLDINANQWGILRWDFSKYRDAIITEAGLLELTSQSVTLGGNYIKALGEDFGMEFGKVRVIEILSGDPLWDQSTVTYNTLTQNEKYSNVFNTQMVYDFDVVEGPVGKNYITISKPVLQRLVDGTTKGLLIRPLGAVDVSFYASENQDESNSAKLYFNNGNGN
ncbi:MAG: hypothetical protein KDC67_16840, partial [Ignavibacteriae bacterium]|nr:hypothetical protein [Ignavibacteriota bacterium]